MSPPWSSSLDAYEATIVELERAAAAGESPSPPPWQPPASLLEVPTPGERARFVELRHRAEVCSDLLTPMLSAVSDDLDAVRRTGDAARAYGRVDHLTGPG
ncbi:MAG: hypothetical protein WD010_01555 [Nitriliruptor sp.]|uniref:hypothetical protein n=1 Tax=Nitriliruptor sp. TaxID=2448056 RepID=UPI0034A04D28